MQQEILFVERQRFKHWWLWIILLGINAVFLYGVIRQVIVGEPFGDKPLGNSGLITVAALTFLLTFFFLSLRLDTFIKHDGIYVQFFPFHKKLKHYPWSTLHKCFIRRYSPIREYGGWGYRLGLLGHGVAYNVSGNEGLQLEFSEGKRLLIGTQKVEQMKLILMTQGQIKE